MEKDFIPYQEALELRDLRFDEPCFGAYGAWGFMSSNNVDSLSDEVTQEDLNNKSYTEEDGVCLAPLYQQAFRFFRDIGISFHISDYYDEESRKRYGRAFEIFINGIQQSFNYPSSSTVELYYTYPEAELALLRKLIEIVKNK